ncbi:hypothetical protein ACH4SP_22995 [Streptomyces sp. NPDC021093]|uniref:hypothetical protein n=1 Tax=Streptomyces sp. NPDC021093 TaxID=3365112 RepID=UPI0037974EE5
MGAAVVTGVVGGASWVVSLCQGLAGASYLAVVVLPGRMLLPRADAAVPGRRARRNGRALVVAGVLVLTALALAIALAGNTSLALGVAGLALFAPVSFLLGGAGAGAGTRGGAGARR